MHAGVALESEHHPQHEAAVELNMKQVKQIVSDLMKPVPIYYWSNMIISSIFGWAGLLLFSFYPWSSFEGTMLFFIGSLSIYRALTFNHDLAHVHGKWTQAFSFVWNLICGIPFFQPTSMYGVSHMDHHAVKLYASEQDPRYLPIGLGGRSGWLIPLLVHSWIVPIFLALRFYIIGPISLIKGGAFREKVIQHSSTLKMNLKYVRRLPNKKEALIAATQEVTCVVIWGTFLALSLLGYLPWKFFAGFYLANVAILVYHYLRSLCLHRYQLIGKGEFSLGDTLVDSVSFNRPWFLVTMLCPINTNYHSLHHMLPSLPYHNLEHAHARLIKQLPSSHPYVRSFEPNMLKVFAELWARTGKQDRSTISAR